MKSTTQTTYGNFHDYHESEVKPLIDKLENLNSETVKATIDAKMESVNDRLDRLEKRISLLESSNT